MDAGTYGFDSFRTVVSHRLRGPNLIFWSMVVASLALSVGSFYTTWIGMMEFVGEDTVGVLVSFIITFGVQSLLYAISWGIAQNWRIGRGRLAGSVIMWLICAFISGFFSFYGFFNTQGGRDELTRQLHVRAEIQDILGGIADRMTERIDDGHARMIDSDEYSDWMRGAIEQVVIDSRNLETTISNAAREESDLLRNRMRQNTIEIGALRDQAARAESIVSSRDADLAKAQEDIRQWQSEIDRLQQRIVDLTDEQNALRAAQEREARTGKGPRWQAMQIDLNTNAAWITAAEAEIAAKTQRLADREAELENLEAVRGAGGANQVLNRLRGDIAELEAENKAIETGLARLETRRSFDADRETAAVETTRRQFENKDYSQYATLVDGCIQLESVIKNNRPPGASGIECRSPFVAQMLDGLTERQTEAEAFRRECIDALPATEDGRIDPLIGFANACLRYEPDGRERAAAYNAMTALKSQRGDAANPISIASVALLQDQQSNAVLALLLAIFVDLLVLICAIIGRHSGESERVRAIDLLFDRSRKFEEDGFEYLVTMPENPNQREIMGELVTMLVRENLADYHSHDGETIALRRGARERLRHERARESGEPLHHPPGHDGNSASNPGPATQTAQNGRVLRGKIRGG